MNKYEAMFIIKPDLTEDERKALFNQIAEAVTKNEGQIAQASIWQERRKLFFPLKKQREGLYYLMNFSCPPQSIKEMNHAYGLNEFILRVLITKAE